MNQITWIKIDNLLLLFCPNVSRPGQRPGHLLFHQVIWPGMTWCSAATAHGLTGQSASKNLIYNHNSGAACYSHPQRTRRASYHLYRQTWTINLTSISRHSIFSLLQPFQISWDDVSLKTPHSREGWHQPVGLTTAKWWQIKIAFYFAHS